MEIELKIVESWNRGIAESRNWCLVATAGLIVAANCGRADAPPADTATPATQSNGTSAKAPTNVPANDVRDVVLILGTSLTAGYGLADPNNAYPALLQRLADSAGFGVHIINAGLSGETSAGALRRIERFLTPPPAIVIVETGANDGLRGLDPDSTAANLRAIVQVIRARAPQARVVIAQMEAPSNLGPDYTARFHRVYGAVTKETGTILMPFLLESVVGNPRLNQDDGIHPTKEGAKKVARNVWATLSPLLNRK